MSLREVDNYGWCYAPQLLLTAGAAHRRCRSPQALLTAGAAHRRCRQGGGVGQHLGGWRTQGGNRQRAYGAP